MVLMLFLFSVHYSHSFLPKTFCLCLTFLTTVFLHTAP